MRTEGKVRLSNGNYNSNLDDWNILAWYCIGLLFESGARMKIFFDTEFTGLHQNTTLISIGLVAENERQFYGEFTDYDQSQIDDWLRENVLVHLAGESANELSLPDYAYIGNSGFIKTALLTWFEQFDEVELWSDCLSYDWVLLSELIADRSSGYPVFPNNFVYHSPYDIATLIRIKKGMARIDISREELAGIDNQGQKHNSLWDAKIIRACYKKLMERRSWKLKT